MKLLALYGGEWVRCCSSTGPWRALAREPAIGQYPMLVIEDIVDQVRLNCDIADAQHAGFYSICGLALRLRDLFKWDKGLDPWVEKDSAEVLAWISAKEQRWDSLLDENLKPIAIHGQAYDPFDTAAINALLAPHGIWYGGGYARNLKPTFFLAAIQERRKVADVPVTILGRELARDLLTLPALTQDNCVLVRLNAAKLYLWDKIFYVRKSGRQALELALANHGLSLQDPSELHHHLDRLVAEETEAFVYHELGELKDPTFDHHLWRRIIATFPNSPIEFLARTLKDLLADTTPYGTLHYAIRNRKAAAIAFYVAFLEGLTPQLFPEIQVAFKEFAANGNWRTIAQAVDAGYATARRYAASMSRIFAHGMQTADKQWVQNEMHGQLLKPLGIL